MKAVSMNQADHWEPSTNWAQGGQILEDNGICINRALFSEHDWVAVLYESSEKASTPLIAAMRCLVASKFGNEIELPEGI